MRYEYKYLVDTKLLDRLRRSFEPYLEPDEYAAGRNNAEYTVRSIYFDTHNLQFYHEKLSGIMVRKKLRIRGYNYRDESDKLFLEIKRKYENKIWKNRAAFSYENLKSIIDCGNIEDLINDETLDRAAFSEGSRFIHHLKRNHLKPVVLITYDREAYQSKFNSSLRITFDKNLRYKLFPSTEDLFDESTLKKAMPDKFVLELKFYNGFPRWLQNILQKYGLTRVPVSKYTICIDHQMHLKMERRRTILNMPGNGSKPEYSEVDFNV